MTTQIAAAARGRFSSLVRRGITVATLAAALAAFALPTLSTSAAACPLTGGDFDFDGISCYDEFNFYGTDPFNADSDFDGYSDSYELFVLGTNPLVSDAILTLPPSPDQGPIHIDSDADGLSDSDEVNFHGTNPYNADTDFDGMSDGAEWNYPSNPLYFDTDGDGVNDGTEYLVGTDLLDPSSYPANQ